MREVEGGYPGDESKVGVGGEDGEGGDGEDYSKQRGERDLDCNLQALVMMMTMLLMMMTMVMITRKMVMIMMT